MTLRARLALALALVATVILLSGVAVVVIVRASLIAEVDHQLSAASAIVAPMTRLRFTGPPPNLPPGLPPGPPPEALTELFMGAPAADGQLKPYVIPGLEPAGPEWLPVVDPAVLTAHTVEVTDTPTNPPPFDAATANGRGYRLVALRSGDTVTVIGLTTDRADATLRRVEIGLVVVGTLILASLAVATWWVERLGLRPIRHVTAAAAAIAGGDLGRRVDAPPAGTEAGHLARAFNVMVDERQAWERQLRRFVADASHELRTPLTTVLGVMELYRRGSLADGERLRDALYRAHREARRMAALVEDLLLLTHLDQGQPLADEPVDLGALAVDAALDARLARPGRRVTTDVAPTPAVRGDASRLRQVVTNLVTNALTHAGPDAQVRVAVRPGWGETEPTCVLEVADDGVGLSPEQAVHVFERFYRVDAGRDRRQGGSGLGLSIVHSIVGAHGGQVTVRTAPGRGAAFRVVLPAGRHFQPTSSILCPEVQADAPASGHGSADHGRDPARPAHDRAPV
jgi:two-component system OmpR family sensor kinase